MDFDGLVGCFQNDSACVFTCLNRDTRKEIDYERISLVSQLHTQLVHPNLIRYHGIVCNEQQSVVIMEKMEWESLRSHLLASPTRCISEEEVRPIFRQIVSAVENLHLHNLSHTKLNLGNVYFDAVNKQAKVGDFVICDRTPPLVKQDLANADMHPYVFMAPEIWFSTGRLDDPKSDIWSLGVMLYTLVCGYYPFFGSNKNELFRGIIQGPAGYPNHLSPLCIDFLVSLMQFSPDERPNIQAVKSHDWLNVGYHSNYITKASLLGTMPSPVLPGPSGPSSGPIHAVMDQHSKSTKRKGSWQDDGHVVESPTQARVKRRNSVATMQQESRSASKMPIPAQSVPRSGGSPRRSSLTSSHGSQPKDQKDLILEQQYIRQQLAAEQGEQEGGNNSAISMQALNGMHPSSQMKILQLQQTLFGNQKGDEQDPSIQTDKQRWIQKIRSSPPQKASDFAERRRNSVSKIVEVTNAVSPPPAGDSGSAPSSPPANTNTNTNNNANNNSSTTAGTSSESNIHKLPSHILNTLRSIQSASALLNIANGLPPSSSSSSISASTPSASQMPATTTTELNNNNNNNGANTNYTSNNTTPAALKQTDSLSFPPPPPPSSSTTTTVSAPRATITNLPPPSSLYSHNSSSNLNQGLLHSNKLFASSSLTAMPSLSTLNAMHGLTNMPSFSHLNTLSLTSSLSLSDIPTHLGLNAGSIHQPTLEPFAETLSFDEFDKYIDKGYFHGNTESHNVL